MKILISSFLLFGLFYFFTSFSYAADPSLVTDSLYSISNQLKSTLINAVGSLSGYAAVLVISLSVFAFGFAFFRTLIMDVLGKGTGFIDSPIRLNKPKLTNKQQELISNVKEALKYKPQTSSVTFPTKSFSASSHKTVEALNNNIVGLSLFNNKYKTQSQYEIPK